MEEKLFLDLPEPSSSELMQLAQTGEAFRFLNDEPDIYSLKDGEAI